MNYSIYRFLGRQIWNRPELDRARVQSEQLLSGHRNDVLAVDLLEEPREHPTGILDLLLLAGFFQEAKAAFVDWLSYALTDIAELMASRLTPEENTDVKESK